MVYSDWIFDVNFWEFAIIDSGKASMYDDNIILAFWKIVSSWIEKFIHLRDEC